MLLTTIEATVGVGGDEAVTFIVNVVVLTPQVIVTVFIPAVLESKPSTIPLVTGIIDFVPSDIVASIFKFVKSSESPTLYSVLWSVLITLIN